MKLTTSILLLMVLFGFTDQGRANPCSFNEDQESIHCFNITTPEDAILAVEYVANTNYKHNVTRFGLFDSNVDLLPNDMIASLPVTDMILNKCSMSEMPFRLTKSNCDLVNMMIRASKISAESSGKTDGFTLCPNFMTLLITQSDVRIPSRAFEGLVNLNILKIERNALEFADKDAFRGLTKLETLSLASNSLKTLPQGLFDPLSNYLWQLNLDDNPLHCNCSLLWLQDWLKAMKPKNLFLSGGVYCQTPMVGDLTKLKFCTNPPKNLLKPAQDCMGAPMLEKLLEQALATLRQDCPR